MRILLAATPSAWTDAAVERWDELLRDHASCEKKAASTALALMFTYPEDRALATALSRLAREELRHFEQVQEVMHAAGVAFGRQKPGRYATELRRLAAGTDPARKLDLLLIGALIEARSCERFELLAPRLPAPLGELYGRLARSEARHCGQYLAFARAREGEGALGWRARLQRLAEHEAHLATAPDAQFRFHSGPPLEGHRRP